MDKTSDDPMSHWPVWAKDILDGRFSLAGQLDQQQVQALCEGLDINVGTLAEQLVAVAASMAVAPCSDFQVGAVAIGTDTNDAGIPSLYLGANIEFPDATLSDSLHAEQVVTTSLWAHGDRLSSLYLNVTPCGFCRQFLYEFSNRQPVPVLLPEQPTTSLDALLPSAFGPMDLQLTQPVSPAQNLLHNWDYSAEPDVELARVVASHGYAPYSQQRLGVLLQLQDGQLIPGFSLENAAFNPGINPLMTGLALTRLAAQSFHPSQIKAAFVWQDGQFQGQLAQIRRQLAAISPDAELTLWTD